MYTKRLLSICLVMLVLLAAWVAVPAAQASGPVSGTYGTSPWKIENGVLTVSAGQMPNTTTVPPWRAHSANITSVVVEAGAKTSANASGLFSGLNNATTIDVRGLDTSQATNIDTMFQGNSRLTSLNVSGLDVSQVTSLRGTFQNTGTLGSGCDIIGLETWNTSKLTSLHDTFRTARILSLSGIKNWNTSKVTNMNSAFYGSTILAQELLDLSGWDVTKVTNLQYAFSASIYDLSIKNWSPTAPDWIVTAFRTTMTRLELNAWNNKYLPDAPAPDYQYWYTFSVKPRVLVLNPNFKFTVNDGFSFSPPGNALYTGKWQAVGTGTEDNPLGPSYTLSELRALYTGNDHKGPKETYVWEKRTISFSVTKVWADNNNQAGMRPSSVTVSLLANKKLTGKTLVLNAQNAWKGSFTGLSMQDEGGQDIVYTIAELSLPGDYFVSITGDAAKGFTLTNTYAPAPTPEPITTYPTLSVPITAKKVLKNGALASGDFSFKLMDSKGKLLAQVKNAKDGSIVFPERTFTRAVSNYVYTIREVKGDNPKITYDGTVYTIKVTTTPVDGKLQATLAYEKNGVPYAGDLVFSNQKKPVPTGDNQVLIMLLLSSAALLLILGAVVINKKRGEN